MNPSWSRLFRKYPWIFVGSTWVVIVMLGILSAKILYSAGREPPMATTSPIPIVSPSTPTRPITTDQDTDTFPLWSLGFIVVSCALSSLMISQRLRPSSRPRSLF